ncbi:pyridoxal-dependent decarboxylase [Ruegeria sp. 2012CJ41-6]|uniref:Pyridoxal-dependent decarboxylase n=1 Tax=Ruegeria spongiae TaxID=2942209 RepID=A0ABT0Q533_9RHOB|nr:pyridoxal-dependent decarboxylase [Ruegeria spongiae]MCL6284943.1 pyridoxal-dependent decarboxylase [Ruegeria spongiae]
MTGPLAELELACAQALSYRQGLTGAPCTAARDYAQMLAHYDTPLPETGDSGAAVIRDLAETATQGLMPMAHPRFFGWVLGGSAPVGVAADWLVSAWGQNAAFHTSSPTVSALEHVAERWLLDILDLPREAAVGFVTGATVGNFTALAAARGAVLRRHGWDPDQDGLFDAPPVKVFLGDDAHTSVFSALGYLGFGRRRVQRIATDAQGRMDPSDLATQTAQHPGPSVVIAQAGQINTGAFDPFEPIADIAAAHGAWLHVDGAFGLWARAHPDYRALTHGLERAQSWAVDGHKWLQTPFDSGYAIVRDRAALETAMGIDASYLPERIEQDRIPSFLVPELSRRARGVPTYAMLRSLGRKGVADMVARHCGIARQIADRLTGQPGIAVLNDVDLNQIILRFGAGAGCDMATEQVIQTLRDQGALFAGGARWRENWVMRLSVICDASAAEDADPVAEAILAAWTQVRAGL